MRFIQPSTFLVLFILAYGCSGQSELPNNPLRFEVYDLRYDGLPEETFDLSFFNNGIIKSIDYAKLNTRHTKYSDFSIMKIELVDHEYHVIDIHDGIEEVIYKFIIADENTINLYKIKNPKNTYVFKRVDENKVIYVFNDKLVLEYQVTENKIQKNNSISKTFIKYYFDDNSQLIRIEETVKNVLEYVYKLRTDMSPYSFFQEEAYDGLLRYHYKFTGKPLGRNLLFGAINNFLVFPTSLTIFGLPFLGGSPK